MDTPLTITDVAKRLQLSSSTIYKYTESGKLPAIKLGNRVRVMEGELSKFLLSCKPCATGGTKK
jgi:excisionase family DNA binding protein